MRSFDHTGEEQLIGEQIEILKAYEVQLPTDVEELEDATYDAFSFGETNLGFWTQDGTEHATVAYEEWIEVTTALEKAFFEIGDGILGAQLIALVSKETAELALEPHRSQAIALLHQTAGAAARMRPLVDRLLVLNPGRTREGILTELREGEIETTIHVAGTVIHPKRFTVLGLLHQLGEKFGEGYESRIWNLESDVVPAPIIELQDPFSKDDETQAYWRTRLAYEKQRGNTGPTVLKISERKTQGILYELESLHEAVVSNPEKQDFVEALQVIEEWLEDKMVYFRDGKDVDFELYHLGMESPNTVMALMKAFDVLKKHEPELFTQFMGVDLKGGKSPYYGSFIHKVMFNTERAAVESEGRVSDLVLRGMMKQLLTLDQRVTIYAGAGAITEESFQALVQKAKEQMEGEGTVTGKGSVLAIWGTMLIRPAIEAEVSRQLEALKEINLKAFKAELKIKLADVEHPMLLLEYISNAPLTALRDPDVRMSLRNIFGDRLVKNLKALQEACREEAPEIVRKVFNQIPLFDYEKAEIGPFAKVALRESMAKDASVIRRFLRVRTIDHPGFPFFSNIIQNRTITKNVLDTMNLNPEEQKFLTDYVKVFKPEFDEQDPQGIAYTKMRESFGINTRLGVLEKANYGHLNFLVYQGLQGTGESMDAASKYSEDIPMGDRAFYVAQMAAFESTIFSGDRMGWSQYLSAQDFYNLACGEPGHVKTWPLGGLADGLTALVTLNRGSGARRLMSVMNARILQLLPLKERVRITDLMFAHLDDDRKHKVSTRDRFKFIIQNARLFDKKYNTEKLAAFSVPDLAEDLLLNAREFLLYKPYWNEQDSYYKPDEAAFNTSWQESIQPYLRMQATRPEVADVFVELLDRLDEHGQRLWKREDLEVVIREGSFRELVTQNFAKITKNYPDIDQGLFNGYD